MKKQEFKNRMTAAMKGPPEFERLWKLMDESGSPTMEIKLFRKEGDKKAYRAIILVEGERDVEEIIDLLEKRSEAQE